MPASSSPANQIQKNITRCSRYSSNINIAAHLAQIFKSTTTPTTTQPSPIISSHHITSSSDTKARRWRRTEGWTDGRMDERNKQTIESTGSLSAIYVQIRGRFEFGIGIIRYAVYRQTDNQADMVVSSVDQIRFREMRMRMSRGGKDVECNRIESNQCEYHEVFRFPKYHLYCYSDA